MFAGDTVKRMSNCPRSSWRRGDAEAEALHGLLGLDHDLLGPLVALRQLPALDVVPEHGGAELALDVDDAAAVALLVAAVGGVLEGQRPLPVLDEPLLGDVDVDVVPGQALVDGALAEGVLDVVHGHLGALVGCCSL